MLTVEQIVAAQKAQLNTFFGLGQKALESVEKVTELNLQASKAAMAETAAHAQALAGVKDVQELLAVQAAAVQPLAEKAASYSRHLYDIAAGAGADISKAASLLGYAPTHRVAEGLDIAAPWYAQLFGATA